MGRKVCVCGGGGVMLRGEEDIGRLLPSTPQKPLSLYTEQVVIKSVPRGEQRVSWPLIKQHMSEGLVDGQMWKRDCG